MENNYSDDYDDYEQEELSRYKDTDNDNDTETDYEDDGKYNTKRENVTDTEKEEENTKIETKTEGKQEDTIDNNSKNNNDIQDKQTVEMSNFVPTQINELDQIIYMYYFPLFTYLMYTINNSDPDIKIILKSWSYIIPFIIGNINDIKEYAVYIYNIVPKSKNYGKQDKILKLTQIGQQIINIINEYDINQQIKIFTKNKSQVIFAPCYNIDDVTLKINAVILGDDLITYPLLFIKFDSKTTSNVLNKIYGLPALTIDTVINNEKKERAEYLQNLIFGDSDLPDNSRQLLIKFTNKLIHSGSCNILDRQLAIQEIAYIYRIFIPDFVNFIDSNFNTELLCTLLSILYSLTINTEEMTT